MGNPKKLTTNAGAPVPDNENSLTAGERGPVLLQDFQLLEKLASLARERIPERVVHAKGTGAFGYFEASADMSKHTRAHLFGAVGRKTPVAVRFSTVGGERGAADGERDPRGFAVKFYTEEGNYDIVGNNTPVFFIRDPFKFADMVHTHKRHPASNLKDPDAFWDFFSHSPESLHQVTVLFSDRGIPANFRQMHGFGCHTFRWVNAQGQGVWIKYHFKAEAGIANMTAAEACQVMGTNPDHACEDLYAHLTGDGTVAWQVCVQIMPLAHADTYRYDPFDVTKVWRHRDYPLVPVGRLVLDRNPENHFAEVEQLAFSPSNFVPGVEASPDKLLQGRLFSYPDAQRYRLGVNHHLLGCNAPQNGGIANYQRDGLMRFDTNGGSSKNYSPNSYNGPAAVAAAREQPLPLQGSTGRTALPTHGRADDFEQAGLLWQLMSAAEQQRTARAIGAHLQKASDAVQARQLEHFVRAHKDYGAAVRRALAEKPDKATTSAKV